MADILGDLEYFGPAPAYRSDKEHGMMMLSDIIQSGKIGDVRVGFEFSGCDLSTFGEPELSVFQAPLKGKGKFVMVRVCLSPQDFLEAQAQMHNQPVEEFTSPDGAFVTEDRANLFRDKIEAGGTPDRPIPTPTFEFKKDGELRTLHQEGRHRGMGARRAGISLMPAYLAVKAV